MGRAARRVYRLLPPKAKPAARRAWRSAVASVDAYKLRRACRISVSATEARTLGQPLISVVMPVYNVGGYLPQAAGSVLSQRYVNLELILVDDGSTDSSGEMCDELARRDHRVRVIHKTNAGLGAARNTGIAAARGEYIAFADSDDYVLPNAYAAMLRSLLRTGSDFVTGNVRRRQGRRLWQAWNQKRSHLVDRDRTTLRDHPDLLYDTVAWNKLFRLGFWRTNVGTFPVGKYWEDMLPICNAFLAAQAVDVLARPVYVWRLRDEGDSITQRSLAPRVVADRMEMIAAVATAIQERGLTDTLGSQLTTKILEADLWIHVRDITGPADAASIASIQQGVRRYWLTAPAARRDEIPVDRRVCYWLVDRDRYLDLPAFRSWYASVGPLRPTQCIDGALVLDVSGCPVSLHGIPEDYLVVS